MVENLGFTNWRDREEMETKEKRQALSQGSWQLLHAPNALPIRVSIFNSQPIFLSNPKKGEITMNGGEDPRRSEKDSQHS